MKLYKYITKHPFNIVHNTTQMVDNLKTDYINYFRYLIKLVHWEQNLEVAMFSSCRSLSQQTSLVDS